jgi:hypothetical protein
MRPQNVHAATTQGGPTLLHHPVRFHLVSSVSVSASRQGSFLGRGRRKAWAVGRHAAHEHEFLDHRPFPIGFGNRLHHSRRACDVDLPYPVAIQDPGPNRIQNEGQMHHRHRTHLAQQLQKLQAGCFFFLFVHPTEDNNRGRVIGWQLTDGRENLGTAHRG